MDSLQIIDPFLPEIRWIEAEIESMPEQKEKMQSELSTLEAEINLFSSKSKSFHDLHHKVELWERRNKLHLALKAQPTRKAELEEDLNAYNRANNALLQAIHKNDFRSNIETITLNYVSNNIKYFSTLEKIKYFQQIISHKLPLSRKTVLFSEWFLALSNPVDLRESCNQLEKYQLDLYVQVISDYFECDEPTLWLICYHLIFDTVIELLSEQWVALYPQFESIKDKDIAIKTFVKLGHTPQSVESLQLSCWLYNNAIEQGNFVLVAQSVDKRITELQKDAVLASFKEKMLSRNTESTNKQITLEQIDKYNGTQFEHFIGHLFTLDGYQVQYTLTSNDKGIDVIARRNGISIGIQCKRYSSTVGIDAVQEVYAGKCFYSLDKAMVITNNYFTNAAIDLAKSTDVVLWDRSILSTKILLL